jgi:4-alpha-glucanotransferase
MQDILGLASETRMNKPGAGEGNWEWRMQLGAFSPGIQARLKEFATLYGRAPDEQADAKQ